MGLVGVFDDSGTHGGEVCVLSGLLASAKAWHDFSEAWREALAKPKSVKYLKMSEANSRHGEFYGLTPQERDDKLAALSCIAGKYSIYASVAILRHSEFRRAFKGINRKKLGPYALLFHKVIFDTAQFVLDNRL